MVQRAIASMYTDARAKKAIALLVRVHDEAQPRVQRARASISIDVQSQKARTLLIESFKEAQPRVQRVWSAVLRSSSRKRGFCCYNYPRRYNQGCSQLGKASIARAQKARISLLEVPKAAQPRVQRVMACIYSDAWKGVLQRLALPLAG